MSADADRPIPAEDERIEHLLGELTIKEKAGQLTQYFSFPRQVGDPDDAGNPQPSEVEAAMARGGVGSLLFRTDPAEINALQRQVIAGNRLGIPAIFGFDVIHGLRTVLPVPIAMAATWDADLITRGQAVAAREARAVGIHWAFAPNVDIARDPRWGRMIEGAGEDPFLGATVAAAQVRGFQGAALGSPERIIAGPKHFAGYGASVGGRDYDEVDLSDSELWNTYLEPFRAAVEAGAGNVMTAYMPLNGVPAGGNAWLMRDVLRGAFGFDGFVVSDANAIRNLGTHHFTKDAAGSAATALNAGMDMEMVIAGPAFASLPEAVRSGAVSEAALDTAVRRVLAAKLAMGILDDPFVDEERARAVLADPEHRAVARTAAERSAVLLRNEGALLPLASPASIAVIGTLADSKRDTLGPWIFDFDLDETVTVLEGIRARSDARVDFAPGYAVTPREFGSIFDDFPGNVPSDPPGFDADAEFARAVETARGAEVAVVVLGEWQNEIGENASRSSLELPGRQLELLQAVVATGTPTVLLLMSGRPLDLRWAAGHVPAIMQIWYPGTRGGEAVANLLLGDVAPTGRMPFTWPRTVGQVPMFYAHTRSFEPQNQGRRYWDEQSTPLFPFGHGLSYTRFAYTDLRLDHDTIGLDDPLAVSVQVQNTGDRDGTEIVQLYLHQRYGSTARPVRLLKAFELVTIPAGGTATVRFVLGPEARRYWSAAVRDVVLEASDFDLWVGGDATAELHAAFSVEDRR